MSLSKERNRERMRQARTTVVQPKCNLNPVQLVQPKLEAQGIKLEGNRIVSVSKHPVHSNLEALDLVQPNLPVMNEYNFRQFKPGDRVLVRRGKRLVETVVPELDAGGQPVPAYD